MTSPAPQPTNEIAPELDSQAIADGLRNQQEDAWFALYDAYSERLWQVVARLIGTHSAEVADIVQATFLAAAQSAQNYDADKGSLWQWLWGIASNQLKLSYRTENRRQLLEQAIQSGGTKTGTVLRWLERSDDSPLEGLLTKEGITTVRATLVDLPAEYSALLTAKYFDGQTMEELAASDGRSAAAISSQLARARRAFRDRYKQLAQIEDREP